MVSYPDSLVSSERALTIRRPPSVASHSSRTSTLRRTRHRAGSSSYGGSAAPTNEFPVFTHTGDVEIVLSNGRREVRYVLHRLILAQCSAWFDESTADDWAGAGTNTNAGEASVAQNMSAAALARTPSGARHDKRRWRFELDWLPDDDSVPMLVQRPRAPALDAHPPPARNKPTSFLANLSSAQLASSTHLPQLASSTHLPPLSSSTPAPATTDPADPVFRDYDNLLRIFYNHAPALDPLNIARAYVECKALLTLATRYSAIPVIGPRVDHHLLRFQGRLWKQIAKYPPSYLKLGYMARSKAIFAEAMVHVVGAWPAAAPQLTHSLPDAVLDLIEDKAEDLDSLKLKIEVKLSRLSLTTSRGDRVSPSSNYLDWTAVSLFRQWLAENTTPPPAPILKSPHRTTTPRPPDAFNTSTTFRLLGSGAYLPRDELKRFLRLTSDLYTRENLKRFERRVDEVKNKARDAVKPLMRNFLELDLREGGLPYLTCTRVAEGDFPWGDD